MFWPSVQQIKLRIILRLSGDAKVVMRMDVAARAWNRLVGSLEVALSSSRGVVVRRGRRRLRDGKDGRRALHDKTVLVYAANSGLGEDGRSVKGRRSGKAR